MARAEAKSQAGLAFLALLAGAIGIGFAPIFVRISEVGPISSAFWRMALSLPLLALWLRLSPQKRTAREGRPWLLIACGLLFAADLSLWHGSITLTKVANATLLANLNPIILAIAGFLFLGERFARSYWLGLVLAMSGALALMGTSLQFAPERFAGDLLAVGASFMYAGYFLTASFSRKQHGALEVLFYSGLATALTLLPMALFMEGDFLPADWQGWLPLLGLALISQIMGQGLIVFALAHLPASFSALSLLAQPIVAALAAWYLFGEALGALEFAGAALILAGIAIARLSMIKRARTS